VQVDVSFLPALGATFLMVFARAGTMVMLLPGLGEQSISPRLRLTIAVSVLCITVALAASPGAFDQAYRSLRRGGRLVCVALPADNATLSLPIFDTVINGKTVIGSIVGTRNDLADVFALHAAGRTTVIAVDRKIDEVNQSIDDVLAGTVPARVVFQF